MKLRPGLSRPSSASPRRRTIAIAGATVVLGVGLPLAAHTLVRRDTDALAARLSEAAGVATRIGDVDADLTGTLRLSDVALGRLFFAERVEASVALASLLSGHLSADEIRIAGPRIAIEVDREGDSDLARVVRRLAGRRAAHPPADDGATRVRRIVVSSGMLTARVAGVGEIAADGVEIVPDAQGVRVITGPLQLRGEYGGVRGELVLARSAAEVSLPHVTFGRVLAVAGTGSLHVGDDKVVLREVAIGRLRAGGALEARAFVDDRGVPRAVGADLAPPEASGGLTLALHGDRVPLGAFARLAPRPFVLTDARATGRLTLRADARAIRLAVDGSVQGLRLDHPTLAPQPIPVDATLSAGLAVSPQAVAVEDATLSIGAARWTASGWLRRGTPVSGQVDVELATAPCADLLASLPPQIRGPLDGLTMTGTFGGRVRLGLDLAAPLGRGVDLTTELANGCVVTAEPPGADVTTLTTTTEHTFPDGSRALVGKDQEAYYPLKRTPSFLVGAFVSAEDARFYEHPGFDITQIGRSLEIDLRDRRLARGGSTISQQLVKNALLTHRRSLDRKIQEAILTWRLESRLDKKAILERYLNIIELGPRIYGIRAAANHWFGRSPRELTIRQAAFLAALTAEPTSMTRRIRKRGGLDPDSAARVDTILRAMYRNGVITQEERDEARIAPMLFLQAALGGES